MPKRESEVGAAVSQATEESDRRDAEKQGSADRMPTPEEERAAEKLPDLDDEVAENYREAIELGANVKGEGQID